MTNAPQARNLARGFLALTVLSTAGTIACDDGPGPEAFTYHADVRVIVEQNCVACHAAGGIGPFALDTFAAVDERKESIVDAIENRRMPPWRHDPACRSVKGANRLSDTEISLVTMWAAGGYLEGDPASFVAPAAEASPLVRAPDVIAAPPLPYIADIARPDDYRCLPLDLEFAQDTYVSAVSVRPDQTDILHHVVLFAVPPASVAEMEALDAAAEGPGYTCFGGSGTELSSTLGGWTPGEAEIRLDDRAAFRISQGSRLVMQMHYNVIGRTEPPAADQSELELWTLPEGAYPDTLLTLMPVADLGLQVAAGDDNSVQVTERHIAVDNAFVVASSPHMHLLGRSLKTEVIREDGTVECLSQIDDWDFGWQRGYAYTEDAIVPLSIDDTVRITCTYDNSAANQPTVNGEQLPPRDVSWGEGTLDEMCLDYLVIAAPFKGAGRTGLCAGYRGCSAACAPGDAVCNLTCMGNEGLGCALCGLDAMFSNCAIQECLTEAIAFNNCFQSCPDRNNDNFAACFSDMCRAQFDAYFTCYEPSLNTGNCPDEWLECGIVAP